MNRKQKIALVVGALVIALLALFPPWARRLAPVRHRDRVYCVPHFDYGRAFLFDRPEDPPTLYMVVPPDVGAIKPTDTSPSDLAIDWARHLPWLVTALALTVAAVVVLRERKTSP